MIKLLIADQQLLTREGIISLFTPINEISIIGDVTEADELKKLIVKFSPDVVMMDQSYVQHLYLPDTSNVDPKLKPSTFLILFNKQDSQSVIKLIDLNIHSFICKESTRDEITEAVYATARGEQFFCECTSELISSNKEDTLNTDTAPLLSSRETEIVHLIADGLTNNQIAEKLFLSFHTVKTHRKNIIKKLGFTFKNAAELSSFIKK